MLCLFFFFNESGKSLHLKKVITFDSVPPQQLWGNIILTEVCALPSANEEPGGHQATIIPNFPPSGIHGALFQSPLHFPNCHMMILSYELIIFSFAIDHYSSEWLCWCSPFKILYPSSDITVAHAVISNCTLSSSMNTHCGDFLPNREFYDCILLKQHVLASHFLTLNYYHVTGAVIFSF
jgi:hypothetical protein